MENGQKINVALHTKDEHEAMEKALGLVKDPPTALTFGSIEHEINNCVADKVAKGRFSRFSAPEKKRTMLRFAKWHGIEKSAKTVTPEIVEKYFTELKTNGLKDSTILGYLMAVRSLFSWLVEKRKLVSNPCAKIDIGQKSYGAKGRALMSDSPPMYCEEGLRDIFLSAWKTIPCEVMDKPTAKMIGFVVHAGFEAGLRKNEIIEARPDWFFIRGQQSMRVCKTDTFTPKGQKARDIPMNPLFAAFMKEFLNGHKGTWCIDPDGVRGVSKYRYDFNRPFCDYIAYVEKISGTKLDDWFSAHVMRHTFGSLLAKAGISLFKISKWMGDSPEVVNAHYAHLQGGDDEINKLHSAPLVSAKAEKAGKAKTKAPRPATGKKKSDGITHRQASKA
ncbi:MAG: tyrosine-type recombinase/integrase [Terrimicrobiaceae bacterium]